VLIVNQDIYSLSVESPAKVLPWLNASFKTFLKSRHNLDLHCPPP
jgi:hypothetical protein